MQKLPTHTVSNYDKNRGLTLIELMIVVALVGIISAVAIPNYRDYIVRGQIVEGQAALENLRAEMERYFQDNRTYEIIKPHIIIPPCKKDEEDPELLRFGNFQLSCDGEPTNTTFLLQAVGMGSVSDFTFKVDEHNRKSTTSVGKGWNTCSRKWMKKKGETC